MATKSSATETKLTAAQLKKKVETQEEKIKSLKEGAWCYMCDTHKARDKFYMSTDPMCKSGLTPICKDCARKIALKVDSKNVEHEPDKESVKLALKYLNKPYLDRIWDSSMQEMENLASGRVKSNIWVAYIRQISMGQYNGMTYFDSDFYKVKTNISEDSSDNSSVENKDSSDEEIMSAYEQNKKDAIRLLGYDPFSKESTAEQPFLYATLIGYLDAAEEANDDRMRLSSIIEIVKGFNHIEKMNDIIARLMNDYTNIEANISTIKNLEDTKSKITASVLKLAADNGISLKHSVNSTKGENTWTGKVRKMKEMNLRDAEVNLYDAEYSAGLKQVADISNASILKQIMLDENDSADMIIQQRELITKYKRIADEYEEKARILLRENIDLKALVKENGINIEED
nr:MAG TPA: hypothetical protein [Caudoviricetes sp.]